MKTKPVDNDHFDEAIDIDGSESVDSDQDNAPEQPTAVQVQAQQKQAQRVAQGVGTRALGNLDTEEFAKAPVNSIIPPNAYNPMHYSNLTVSAEISELFQYISRYHPHDIELETKLKPFIPDYVPAVGEVDAFLKIPRPDGNEEVLGLYLLVICFDIVRMNLLSILSILLCLKCNTSS